MLKSCVMNNVRDILKANDFRFSKKFGQNFITDTNLLAAIADDAQITSDDTVLEIGVGAGTLTAALAKRARRVIGYEIDTRLEPTLRETLNGFDNVQIVYKDIMKASEEEIQAVAGGTFKVVANLPYYITSPILFFFLESNLKVESITVMVQKEVAERMVARPSTADYGALTVAVGVRSRAKITRIVSRKLFLPEPNVDSAVIRLDMTNRDDIMDMAVMRKVTRAAFAMRRKTLVNNLVVGMGITRADAEAAIASLGADTMVRGEALDIDSLVALANYFACGQNSL